MVRIAVYGKGGIGKSTTVSNIAAALALKGLKVMQIGCDPKADSTLGLRQGKPVPTVLDLVREYKDDVQLTDMVTEGYAGVLCVEAGGPKPGHGCAGRGIINALEKLESKGAYKTYQPDVVLYDVLGDVVCGGFTMPMRNGYADKVYILTSGEAMSVYAAANIAMAVSEFKDRGYASLGGFILNRRNCEGEEERVQQLAADFDTVITGELQRSELVTRAEAQGITLMEAYPDSEMAQEYIRLAEAIMADIGR